MKSKKRQNIRVIYNGRSQADADEAAFEFWHKASPQEKMNAVNQMITEVELRKGKKLDELRLCRSTAIIRRP